MIFKEKLIKISIKNNSLVCVGLDSDISKIPEKLKLSKHPQFVFNKAIIDATHDLVCAYKPNTAFYEAEGPEGITDLKMTFDYINEKYPEIPSILDAKRADIGNTNLGYIKFAFSYLKADSITLHPYLGKEALMPFLENHNKGIFILVRTSNPGADELQDIPTEGRPLFQKLTENIVNNWNTFGNCGLVVGATYPTDLKIVRHMVADMPILIPGIGAQGGDIARTINAGVDKEGLNAIINSSRSIIFASSGADFDKKAYLETIKLRDEINKYR